MKSFKGYFLGDDRPVCGVASAYPIFTIGRVSKFRLLNHFAIVLMLNCTVGTSSFAAHYHWNEKSHRCRN